MNVNDLREAAARAPFYRLRFADGYVFRMKASDEDELRAMAAEHYWWGDQKPDVSEIRLTIKSRRNTVFYVCDAPGYPKGIHKDDDF